MVDNKKLPVHIEEYFKNKKNSSAFIELFESQDDDFDLKTHLTKQEIPIANVISLNDEFLRSKGINSNIFGLFINGYCRYRVSLDRLSRTEFVKINKKDNFDDNLNTFHNLDNLKKVKE